KGFTKAVSRLPHTLSTKTGMRNETKDPEFMELNKKFTACEKTTVNLLTEVCKYRDNVTSMLNCQAEFSIILAEIYDPSIGMPQKEVTPRRTQTAPESMQAVDDFQAVMRETRDILLPEIDRLELQVVRPLTEMQNNMKLIRKTMIKRDHKLVDYDRYRISLKKLRDKKERSLGEERQIYKLESQLELATADYEGLNSLLIEELPGFFYYKTQLIEPIFHIFYYLQLRIYSIMLDRMGPISANGYFDLSMDVKQGYEARKQETLATVESVEQITKKSAAALYTSKYSRNALNESPDTPGSPSSPSQKPWQAGAAAAPPGLKPWQTGAKPWQTGGAAAGAAGAAGASKPWQGGASEFAQNQEAPEMPPPPSYNTLQRGAGSEGSRTAIPVAAAYSMNSMNNVKKGPPPPVPPKKIGGAKMVVALYDYDAQQEGDLSFRKDEQIELIERTGDVNGWWTGRVNGRQGIFPAVKRIMQEARELVREPSTDFAASPLDTDIFEWHFTIRGPEETDFEGGLYHGRILLPNNYPFAPPSLMFLTPNGRFELHKKVCLSITGYHPEYWQPAWGIRTVLVAVMGFLPTQSKGAIGGLDTSVEARKALAIKSRTWVCPTCGTENIAILPDVAPEDVVKASLKADEMPPEFSFGYEADKKKQQLDKDENEDTNTGGKDTAVSNENDQGKIDLSVEDSRAQNSYPPLATTTITSPRHNSH
ncbi:Ubiquitin-conjugating enzyme E2 J1, partial [Entomortierella lignicola]